MSRMTYRHVLYAHDTQLTSCFDIICGTNSLKLRQGWDGLIKLQAGGNNS